jgi:cysteine desulfuration protein SufE
VSTSESESFTTHRPLTELIEDFEFLDDWEDRYAYLIDLGKGLKGLPEASKNEINRVRGCTSQVWLIHEITTNDQGEEVLRLTADSDAFIVRGLVVVLLSAYDNKTKADVNTLDLEGIFKQMGLERNLSVSRRNGFAAMVERVKRWAQI